MNKKGISDTTADVIGATIGGVIGSIGGPKGIVLGSMAGPTIANTLKDFAQRLLSNREVLRVSNAATYIAEGILEKQRNGEIVRQDDFFEGDVNFTSNGSELLEGVLMKCKEQFQERKVRFISNIFKNVAFNSNISPQVAYQAISIAEGLTYQKFCLLSYCGRKEDFADFNILKDPTTWYDKFQVPPAMDIAIQDLLEMHFQGLLTNYFSTTSSNSIVPGTMNLTAKGQMAYDLMELNQVERNDIMVAILPLEFPQYWGISSNGTLNGIRQPGS